MEGNFNNNSGNENRFGSNVDSSLNSNIENEIKNTSENNDMGSAKNVGADTPQSIKSWIL